MVILTDGGNSHNKANRVIASMRKLPYKSSTLKTTLDTYDIEPKLVKPAKWATLLWITALETSRG